MVRSNMNSLSTIKKIPEEMEATKQDLLNERKSRPHMKDMRSGEARKPPSVDVPMDTGGIYLSTLPTDPKTGQLGHLGLLRGGLAVSSDPHRRQGLTHHPT